MNCRVCESETSFLFRTTVLNKYSVAYYECPTCDFVQTETPYWLEEAYSHAFTSTDTGTLQRSLILGKSAATLAFFAFDRNARFIDYAGGYGTLARYMRDIGFDYYTTDLYATNFMARGFDAQPGRYEMATAFECFEHFEQPAQELEKILAYSDSIFFTTQPCPKPAPAISNWWYYSPHHGQHIALYRPKTLEYLGKQYGLHYYNLLNYHLLTKRRLSAPVFWFLVAAGRFGLNLLVNLLMKSRTLSDQELLKK
ncbi:class I SAM-dependent methyltransferase [Spirosoma gilvum]